MNAVKIPPLSSAANAPPFPGGGAPNTDDLAAAAAQLSRRSAIFVPRRLLPSEDDVAFGRCGHFAFARP